MNCHQKGVSVQHEAEHAFAKNKKGVIAQWIRQIAPEAIPRVSALIFNIILVLANE